MHTQIGEEGRHIAHTLVIIDTGMRTVPETADQQIRRDRDPFLAKNDEVLRRFHATQVALSMPTELTSAESLQRPSAGNQAATGAASLLSFMKNKLVEFRGRYPVSGAGSERTFTRVILRRING
eukprot:6192305-Pleurochrysis_carterae.AAC.2